jgi:Holliday junction resolvase RusA-like endonuclease
MVKFLLTIPAEPIAQGRPRLSSRGGFARAYDPPKSRSWKALVADFAEKAMRDQGITKPMEGPLMVKIRFGFPLPKSQYRKNPKPMMWHMKRPDLDNLYKGVIDAMEGIVYPRDSEIVKVIMDKVIVPQGEAPYVNLAVMTVEALGL